MSIEEHFIVYRDLRAIRENIQRSLRDSNAYALPTNLVSDLLYLAEFDLRQYGLDSFNSFRFLYERLLGAGLRPYLPSVFVAAAVMPIHTPEKRVDLLDSISVETVATLQWSETEPVFVPEWIEYSRMEEGA